MFLANCSFSFSDVLSLVKTGQLDDARETEIFRQIADAMRHDADFWMRQSAQRGFVKMIEVRVRQQHQINPRQVADF